MSSNKSLKVPRKKRRIEVDDAFNVEPPDHVDWLDEDELEYVHEVDETNPCNPGNVQHPVTFNKASTLFRGNLQDKYDSDSSGQEFEPETTRRKVRTPRDWRNSKLGISSSSKTSTEPDTHRKSLTLKMGGPSTSRTKESVNSQKSSKLTSSGFINKISKYFKPSAESSKSQDKPSTSTSGSCLKEEIVTAECSADKVKKAFLSATPNFFGLLGEDTDEDMPCYFDRLPVHVMETIFCQIPIINLLEYRTVCSTWDSVIKDDSFVRWKKLYYGYKNKQDDALEYLQEICISHDLLSVEECFKVLIMFMSEEFGTKPSSDMYECLSQCQNAVVAELVLNERFPEVLTKESKSWCILATAIWISENVSDVIDIYEKLTALKSDCNLHDITNALYCIAAFLLHYALAYKINQGLHYRLFSALYWIENTLPKRDIKGFSKINQPSKVPGQQSLHMYCDPSQSNLTYEQLRILNHSFQHDHILKIVALAGTGKTTTLIHLAQMYPQVNFLNVMFNRAVCEVARKRFPPNVTCKTAHSLAYQYCGQKYRFKLATKIRPHDLVNELKHHTGSKTSIHSFSKYVLNTIENFVASVDKDISMIHVPCALFDGDRPKILKDAKQVWEKMIDRENKSVRITHDTYLKLYQLSSPKFTGFQCLMVDEAQDCNPAILDVLMTQKLPVILVGDPNQQIYGFRGAKNALQSINSTHTYHLTKSFRFGPEISYIASCCLSILKQYNKQTIVGTEKPSFINGTVEGQYAIIARTNAQLFNEAIRICCLKRLRINEPTTVLGAFAGGLRSYNYDQMLDILKLRNHSLSAEPAPVLSDKFLSKFKSYRDLHNYARNVEDSELLIRIELVNQHGEDIVHYLSVLKEKCNHPIHSANIVFTTAHKAKGLEFDTVCLTDDYPIITGFESSIMGQSNFELSFNIQRSLCEDESNIIYVALTRAKKSLLMPDKLLRVLLTAQEKFEYPVSAKKELGSRESLVCVNCTELFTPHTVLVLKRRKIVTAYGRTHRGGALCIKCATEPYVRPRVQIEPVVMYLDPTADLAHRSMAAIVGPLPNDPPIERDTFGPLNEMDVVYIINVNV